MRKLLPLVFCIFTFPQLALADWRNTRWKMTPDEVQALFPDAKGAAQNIEHDPAGFYMLTYYNSPAGSALLDFQFTPQGLVQVTLMVKDFRCDALHNYAVDLYGPPHKISETKSQGVKKRILWEIERDDITFFQSELGCSLIYNWVDADRGMFTSPRRNK